MNSTIIIHHNDSVKEHITHTQHMIQYSVMLDGEPLWTKVFSLKSKKPPTMHARIKAAREQTKVAEKIIAEIS